MLDDYKDILTVHDLCEIMPIGRNSIYNLLHTNRIKNSSPLWYNKCHSGLPDIQKGVSSS